MTKEIKTQEEFHKIASKLYKGKNRTPFYQKYDEEAADLSRTLFLRINGEFKDELLQKTMTEMLDAGYIVSMENLTEWLSGDLSQGEANLRGSIVATLINTATPTDFLELREMYRSIHAASFTQYGDFYQAYTSALNEIPEGDEKGPELALMKDTLLQICQANARHVAELTQSYAQYDKELARLQAKAENAFASLGGDNVAKH